jgi:phage FluMu protein Com
MPIEFRCESCSKLLRTPDESAGKKAKCPQCGTIVDVPNEGGPATEAPAPTQSPDPFATPESPSRDPNPFGGLASSSSVPDSENPYASPSLSSSVEQAKPTVHGELVHGKISFDDLLNTAWSITMDNLGPMATIGAILFGINIAMTIVNQVVSGMANASGVVGVIIGAQFLSFLISMVVQTWCWIVAVLYCTRMARDRQADLNVVSQSGPFLVRALGFSIVLYGIVLLIMLVFCGTPALITWIVTRDEGAALIAAIVGFLVGLIPMSVVWANLMLAMFFVVDRQQGVFAAMGTSRRFMQGNKLVGFLTYFVVQMVGGIFIMCTCCFGRVLFDPFSMLVMALMYLTATGQPFLRPMK